MRNLIIGFVFFCWCGIAAASTIHAKKNEAYFLVFAMLDEVAPGEFKVGVTVTDTCKYSDAGGAWTTLNIADSTTQIASTGMYALDMTAGEMNHDRIVCKFTGAGAVDNMLVVDTYAVNIDDLVRSTTPANTLDISASGAANSNLLKINGDNQSMLYLKDFVNNGYDSATDKVQGVVLVDTTTVNTDMITTAAIVGGVWNESIVDHVIEGSYGKRQYDMSYPFGVTFYWDTTAANDTGNGLSLATAKKTWSAVLALVTSGRGDTIVMVEGSSSDAEITMNKDDLTLKCSHPQRCTLTKTTGSTTTTLTMSADRMTLEGIKIDATSSGTANNGLLITGEDCIVRRCLFAAVDNTSITITGDRTIVDDVVLYEYSDSFTPKIDEIQTIAITGTPSAGTWTITCEDITGVPTETDTIAWNGDNAAVQTVLDDAFAVNAIVVGGTFMSAQTLTFSGAGYTGVDKAMCTVDITFLVGATEVTVVETIKGVPDVYDKSPGIFIDGTAALEGVVVKNSRFAGSGGSVTTAIAMDGANLVQTRIHNNIFQDNESAYAVVELSSGPTYTAVYNNTDALSKGYVVVGVGSEVINSGPYALVGSSMNLTGSAVADLWDENTVLHTGTNTFGKLVNDITTDLALERADTILILADTNETQGKLPSGTLSEFNAADDPVEIRSTGGTVGTNAQELVDDMWDEITNDHVVGGTFGKLSKDVLDDTAAIQPLSATTDATVNHVTYGNAQLIRATTPANTLDTDVTGNVSADVIEISGDAIAADALETMLDGTGGNKLHLSQLNIVATGNDAAFIAAGAGDGSGIRVQGGFTGPGMTIASSSFSLGGLIISGSAGGFGVWILDGMKIDATTLDKDAIWLVATGAGKAIKSLKSIDVSSFNGNISGDITGNISGSVGSVVANVVTDAASRTASKADVSNLDVAVSTRSSHLAADVWTSATRVLSSVTAIVDGVWDELISSHVTVNTFGDQLGTIVDAVLVDTDQIQGKLPTGLITDSATITAAMTSYDVAKQGEEMDFVNAPNATAITAIQSGLSTFAVGQAVTLSNNALTSAAIADGAITTIKVATPDDFKADLTNVSTFDSTSNKVTLDNTAHGGIASTLTLERVIVKSTTLNTSAVELVGDGTGDGLNATGGTAGDGITALGGATNGNGMVMRGVGTGDGFRAIGGSTSGDGIEAVLGGSGVDIRGDTTGGMVGNVTGNVSGSVGSVTDAVTTDAASRTASQANVSALALEATLSIVDTVVDGIQTDLNNGVDGLGALKTRADAIETDTQDLQTQVGVAGVGLTNLGGMSVSMKGEVESEAHAALVVAHLDHLLEVDYDPAATPGAPTALLNEVFADDGSGSPQYTANALALGPSGGASAAVIADAVWNESSTGHLDAGKAGQQLWTDTDAILVQVDAIKAETTLIVADTNELQSDDIPLQLSNLNDTTAVEVWTAVTRTVTGGTIDTNIDMRGTNNAALAVVCTETRLAELDAANLPADVTAIPTTPERGTNDAALAVVCTPARLSELDAINLPADVAAIPTTPERGTDNAALAAVCTESRLAELDATNLPLDISVIPTTPERGTDGASTHTAAGVWAEASRTVTGGTINLNTTEQGTDGAATVGAQMDLIDAPNPLAIAAITVNIATAAAIAALNDIDAAIVETAVTTSLNAYDAPTKTEMDAGFAGVSTHDADAVVTAIFARVGDGLTFDSAFEAMQAVMYGKSVRVGNTVTFYKNDNVTAKVTATLASGGVRSSVTVFP